MNDIHLRRETSKKNKTLVHAYSIRSVYATLNKTSLDRERHNIAVLWSWKKINYKHLLNEKDVQSSLSVLSNLESTQ